MSDSLYEAQVLAAKFRAERDQARQECERLRARLRDSVPREAYERKRAAWLRQIRECETALHKRREYIKKLENAALERRTVREEDHEAAEWVREHGGLDNVKKLLDWVVGHCSTKQQLDFDFWLSGRVMHELGFDDDMADRDEVERRLLARLMPEGYEWPRYESGELVLFGDEFINAKGNASTLRTIAIKDCRDALGGAVFWKLGKGACAVTLKNGERVKRPVPKVLDADGAEMYLKCTRCGADIEPGSRHKVVAKTEGGRNHWGDTTWSTDETAYLCGECFAHVLGAMADRGQS